MATGGTSAAPKAAAATLPRGRLWLELALVVAACVPVFWLGLGHAGLGATEGHRAIPAWEMLDNGEWWLPHLFDRVYLRKPPGMAWAIAASSAVLGRTEFAARAVSASAATASAVVALLFARRWFGARAGLPAGLAQALMPVWFVFARSAEIESLHTLACQVATFLCIDLALRRAGNGALRSMGLCLAIFGAGVVKGPAGAPVLAGAIAASAIAGRSAKGALRPAILIALAGAGALLGAVLILIRARLASSGLTPVLQDPSEFAPSLERLPKILRLFPAALLEALPVTGAAALALWPGNITRERESELGVPADSTTIARALALTYLLSVVFLMLSGVSNPRYALPALTPLAPVAGWAWLGRLGLLDGWRRRVATWTALWRLWALPAVALVLIPAYTFIFMEPRRAEVSGKDAGVALADALTEDCTIYADWLVEARPEVLSYARQRAAERGVRVRVKWVDFDTFTPPGHERCLVAARTDGSGHERSRQSVTSLLNTWRMVHSGTVYKYNFEVWERAITPAGPGESTVSDDR